MLLQRQVLPLYSPIGDIDWWLRGQLTRLFISNKFKADEGETLFFTSSKYCQKNKNFLLFGMGSIVNLDTGKGEYLLESLKNQLNSLNTRIFLLVVSKELFHNLPIIKQQLKGFSFDVCV